ncbi:hypothetical protein B0H17DRAFT_1342481, partial [Mycena rosella]
MRGGTTAATEILASIPPKVYETPYAPHCCHGWRHRPASARTQTPRPPPRPELHTLGISGFARVAIRDNVHAPRTPGGTILARFDAETDTALAGSIDPPTLSLYTDASRPHTKTPPLLLLATCAPLPPRFGLARSLSSGATICGGDTIPLHSPTPRAAPYKTRADVAPPAATRVWWPRAAPLDTVLIFTNPASREPRAAVTHDAPPRSRLANTPAAHDIDIALAPDSSARGDPAPRLHAPPHDIVLVPPPRCCPEPARHPMYAPPTTRTAPPNAPSPRAAAPDDAPPRPRPATRYPRFPPAAHRCRHRPRPRCWDGIRHPLPAAPRRHTPGPLGGGWRSGDTVLIPLRAAATHDAAAPLR